MNRKYFLVLNNSYATLAVTRFESLPTSYNSLYPFQQYRPYRGLPHTTTTFNTYLSGGGESDSNNVDSCLFPVIPIISLDIIIAIRPLHIDLYSVRPTISHNGCAPYSLLSLKVSLSLSLIH